MNHHLLELYANVILEFGLKVEEGEKIVILFDENGLELARQINVKAYQFGASDVRHIYNDSIMETARYIFGSEHALNHFPKFEADYQLESMKEGYHSINLLSFRGVDKEIEPSKIATYQKVCSKMMQEARKLGMSNFVKWVIAPVASSQWAKTVFPNEAPDTALEHLWNDLLNVCRINLENPTKSWMIHNENLKKRTTWLNELELKQLHFKDSHTDYTVELVDGHIWCGGENSTIDGKVFLSNIPTEEVYTMPNKYKVNGFVKITRPFILYGEMIEDLLLYFENGKVVRFDSTGSTDLISRFIQTDDGSNRLGEIALVDKFSPINQINHPFYQVLIDENACSHLALGNAYDENIKSEYTSKEEIGFNQSSVHLDLMIGSNSMSVVGIKKDGEEVPIMKDGTWVDIE